MDYTHTALLAAVRRLAAAPTATASGSASSDLLAHANEELQSYVVPLILDLREEYFLQVKSQTMTVGTAAYRLPSRAIGAKLREVEMVDSAGNVTNLRRLAPDMAEEFPTSNGTPYGYHLRGNSVVLVPTPAVANTLRLTYYLRPNEVVSTAYGTVSTIVGSVVTYTETGTFAPTTSSVIDLIAATSGFECHSVDVTPSAADTTANTVTVTVPTDLAVGDYVVTRDQTPVPQIPSEFHPLLYTRTALRFAESNGATNRIGYLTKKSAELEEKIRGTFAPRVDGEPIILKADAYGLLGLPDGGWDW